MKSKLSSKSLAKTGLKVLPLILFLSACTSSTTPTFLKEGTAQAVKDICKKEYGIDVSTRIIGSTLWVYLPLEDILSPTKGKPSPPLFFVEDEKNFFDARNLKINYYVKVFEGKAEGEGGSELKKEVYEKNFNILQVIRRVLFSIDNTKHDKPLFFCIVTADIKNYIVIAGVKNGFEIKQVFYLKDLKKLSYGIISQTEYQHRIVQDTILSPEIIGDKEGRHLDYKDITLEEFIADQIRCRIRIKFQKPEVGRDTDIDKEILKITAYTLNIYKFEDFNFVELMNLVTGAKVVLNQAAILANSKE